MSKKLSQMPPKGTVVDLDYLPIFDTEDPAAETQNKTVSRNVFLSGIATQSAVDAVQANLDTHTGTGAGTAHPDGVTQTDLSNHKTANNQHPIAGVTGLQAALDAKADTASLGTAATRDVGTLPTQVAAGDAPANAVSSHESSFDHANLPTTAQKAALDGNPALGGANVVPGRSELPTADQQAAMDAANSPSGVNAFATMADVGSGGTHAGLPDLNTSGHPGTVITIPAGVQGNAVSIAANGTLQDSGTPPGGSGTTNLSNTPSASEVTVESSSGTNTSIVGATGSLAGVLVAADKTKLDNLPANPWADGSTVTDWGLTVQALGSLGAGTSAVDLDNGHHITATLTADRTFNFSSTANHPTTQWTATIATGGFTPTWQFGGVAIDLPSDYDISGSPQRIEFSFIRTAFGVSVSERRIP